MTHRGLTWDTLRVADLFNSLENLRIAEFRETQDCTAGLDWLDDLGAIVASKREARSGRVNLHGASKSLLCRCGHRVGLVQNDDLVSTSRQCHLLLREHLDLVAHHIDPSNPFHHSTISISLLSIHCVCHAPIITCVEFEDGVLGRCPEKRSGKAQDAGGLAGAWRTRQNQVVHVPIFGDCT